MIIHIEGQNINPFMRDDLPLTSLCRKDPERYEQARDWQEKLHVILAEVVQQWSFSFNPPHPAIDRVSCYFAPDTSVPAERYPTAMLLVRMPKSKAADSTYNHYAKTLGEACEKFLNKLRDANDARVNVVIDFYNPDRGCYSTPPKK